MKLRRGFKTEAETIALEIRRAAGATLDRGVDVRAVARSFKAEVVSLNELRDDGATAGSVRHFLEVESDAFSALTVSLGERALIVYNESHTQGRIANSVAHETSHLALKHSRPSSINFGCRQWDKTQEDEADWLGGCILVPRSSAAWVVQRGMALAEAARRFGVSEQLMRMRINVTGVAKIAERRRAWRP